MYHAWEPKILIGGLCHASVDFVICGWHHKFDRPRIVSCWTCDVARSSAQNFEIKEVEMIS